MDCQAVLERVERESRAVLKPPPQLTVSQWADQHRKLSPESAAEPGQWRTDRAPYQREIMDAVTDPLIREVVVMKSAQVGWTEILGNVVGFHIDRDPSPILLIQPTLEMAETWSKDRLAPMVRDTPALQGKIKDARSRDSGNTLLHKTFPGGHITIAGANSPAGLASRPIRIVLCDEVDRYPASAGTEGDPISLARKRATTFWNRKVLMGSTPTVKGESRIEAAFEVSDQRYYLVPCPHCETEDRLTWANVKWPPNDPRRAYYACPHCGAVVDDRHKPYMLARGRWQATAGSDGIAGFHLNELYSPWVKFGDMAVAFVEAKDRPEMLQTWVNTCLGETWVERGEVPKLDAVLKLRADYRMGDVPDGALALTCGVDVQRTRLVYEIRAWGPEMASWVVEFGELWGETDQPDVWNRLSDLTRTEYGGRLIRVMLIDSGYLPDKVYAFCRTHGNVAKPSKGHDTLSIPVRASKVDVSHRGVTIKASQQLWHVDASYFKTMVHNRLAWPQDQPGAWHLPADIPEEYARQLIAESRIVLPNGKAVWKRHDRENHALDCAVLNCAAARILGIDRIRPRAPEPKPEEEVPMPPPQPIRRVAVMRGRFR